MTALAQLAFTLILSFTGVYAMALEKPDYRLVQKMEDIEIREYPSYIVARTLVAGNNMERAGNEGFRRLAGYIFGGNLADQKIAMTAPVTMAPAPNDAIGTSDDYWLTFMMPGQYSLDDLPDPADPRVELVRQDAQVMAVLPYRGGWSEARYREHETSLRRLVNRMEGWRPAGEPVWSRYDPPMVPWFMRRNEVAMPIVPVPSNADAENSPMTTNVDP
ncbi:MAG: heme-binding protein [Proteobacteria bacterium]|jgi:hypothetical protein|nr:heme-binding protein [Pseudomonadota bacterium]MDA1302480.1 heme-binding protein [Pseudomonadota bacterium]